MERLAKVYDADILPIWGERFARMLLRDLAVPPKAMVLDVGTGTGHLALEVLRRMDDQGRVVAIEASSAMLDVAREKAGALAGKRIFFRTEAAGPRLSFATDVYDLVLSSLALAEADHPGAAIADFARVAKPGGRVLVAVPIAGTFREFVEVFRGVLAQLDRRDALDRLGAYEASLLTVPRLRAAFDRAGLVDVEVERESYKLLFRSGREFFFAPVIEYGPLLQWRAVAGQGEAMQDAFWRTKDAIDAARGGRPFAVTVELARVVGRKPREEELMRALPLAPGDDEATAQHLLETVPVELVESTLTVALEPEDAEIVDEELLDAGASFTPRGR